MKKEQQTARLIKTESAKTQQVAQRLLVEIRSLVESTRAHVAQTVNSGLVLLYWQIGKRIRKDTLGEERAAYGKQIVATLSRQLTAEYGQGFSDRNLAYMIRVAEVFPDQKILHTLCAQLSWSHIRRIIYIDDDLKRNFYAEFCRIERWSVRTLEEYMTELPARKLLEKKLHQAIITAREQLAQRTKPETKTRKGKGIEREKKS